MKSVVFLALLAAAVAHWPYADEEDKFRPSGLTIVSTSLLLPPMFKWTFYPINNQLLPTFQLRFPNVPTTRGNVRNGITYTIALDHITEIIPDGGVFQLIPGTTVDFNGVIWYTDQFKRFYDTETLGEVVDITYQSYAPNLDKNKPSTSFIPANRRRLQYDALDIFPACIRLRLYPDSEDDLIDISVHLNNYLFTQYVDQLTDQIAATHFALFFRIASSNGDEPDRNVPLSLDYDALTFELDPIVQFAQCVPLPKKRMMISSNSTARFTEPVVPNKDTIMRLQSLRQASNTDDVTLFEDRQVKAQLDQTQSQLWISGGFVAAVFGILPSDISFASCVDFETTVTIAARTFRSVPEYGSHSSSSY